MLGSRLLEQTRELLDNRPKGVTFKRIAEETQLSMSWLSHFAADNCDDPGVIKIETLWRYLSKRELSLD